MHSLFLKNENSNTLKLANCHSSLAFVLICLFCFGLFYWKLSSTDDIISVLFMAVNPLRKNNCAEFMELHFCWSAKIVVPDVARLLTMVQKILFNFYTEHTHSS